MKVIQKLRGKFYFNSHAIFGLVISFLIPFGIWFALRSWKPKTRKNYAAKFSLWSFIIFSHFLGYPIARAIFWVKSSHLQSLDHAIPGIIVTSFMGSPFAFGIDYLIARKKFKYWL